MGTELEQPLQNLAEVVDRLLDKGVVIDAYVRVSIVGIDLVTVDARVVVAGIETYLTYEPTLAERLFAFKTA